MARMPPMQCRSDVLALPRARSGPTTSSRRSRTRWIARSATFAERAGRFGYAWWSRRSSSTSRCSSGSASRTDVVRKEMYDFEDKGGRRIALRPEGTAPVVRAFVQHRPPAPWKVWYVAPHFRYERPQKGRYRQHWQVGAEVLGRRRPRRSTSRSSRSPTASTARSGCATSRLSINSMGDAGRPRRATSTRCASTCSRTRGALGDDVPRAGRGEPAAGARLEGRRLAGRDRARAADHRAPRRRRRATHFEAVQRGLDRLGIALRDRRRGSCAGFDYYTSTTFEFGSDALDAAQNAIGGGGRYDKLAEQMGGPPTPGHRVRHRHRAGADRVRRRGRRRRRRRAAARRVRRRRHGRTPTEVTLLVTELREDGHARRPRLRWPVGEGADEGGRPVGRAVRA